MDTLQIRAFFPFTGVLLINHKRYQVRKISPVLITSNHEIRDQTLKDRLFLYVVLNQPNSTMQKDRLKKFSRKKRKNVIFFYKATSHYIFLGFSSIRNQKIKRQQRFKDFKNTVCIISKICIKGMIS